MPQPVEIGELADPLIEEYRKAWDRITAEIQQLALDPMAVRKRRRLIEMRRAIESVMEQLDASAATWVSERLPQVYSTGLANGAAASAAPEAVVWNAIQQEAVEELAGNLFQELLQSTDHVRDDTKRLVREVGRSEALYKAIAGGTAVQAGREMERILARQGVSAMTYKNGAKHGLAEYAQMAIRTTTAKAYNVGFMNATPDVEWFEVFDGPQCGWAFHGDLPALGRIVSREQAMFRLISHPNCRRAFGARPDIESEEDARNASTNVTREQTQAQMEQDAGRQQQRRATRRRGGVPAPARAAARQAKLDSQAIRAGKLAPDLPRSPGQDRLMPQVGAPPRIDNPGVYDLLKQGYSPSDAVTTFHRQLEREQIKVVEQAREAAQRAKRELIDEDLASTGEPRVLHSQPGGPGGGTAPWHDRLKQDHRDVIPVVDLDLTPDYKVGTGLATRRNGVSYLMETANGQPITDEVRQHFERVVSKLENHNSQVGKNGLHKGYALVARKNPHDTDLPSAATASRDQMILWDGVSDLEPIRAEQLRKLAEPPSPPATIQPVPAKPIPESRIAPTFDKKNNLAGARYVSQSGKIKHPKAVEQKRNLDEIGASAEEMQAKANAVAEITERLNNRAGWQALVDSYSGLTDEHRKYIRQSGQQPPEFPKGKDFDAYTPEERTEILSQEVNRRISRWAATSGGVDMQAIAMQAAVKEELRTGGNPWRSFQDSPYAVSRQTAESYVETTRPWFHAFVRAQYDATQESFRREGITHVSLWRGMVAPDLEKGVQRLPLSPASSWTTQRAIAQRFTKNARESDRVFLSAQVPVDRILGTPRTGFGAYNEKEMVVLDDPDGLVGVNLDLDKDKLPIVPGAPAPAPAAPAPRKPVRSKRAAPRPLAREFDITNSDQAQDWVDTQGESWRDSLSADERKAVEAYADIGGSFEVNKALRSGTDPDVAKVGGVPASVLDAAIRRSVLTEDVVVWRGSQSPSSKAWNWARNPDPGFVSTAAARDTAEGYLDMDDPTHTLYRITIRKGTPAAAIHSDLSAVGEAEVLLPRNTRVNIGRTSTPKNSAAIVEVEISSP